MSTEKAKYVGKMAVEKLMSVILESIKNNTVTSDQVIRFINKIIDDDPDRFKGDDAVIDASFLTEEGFGNLRYYNGHFQYFDADTGAWIDTSVTPENVYIINMLPQQMQHIVGAYDHSIGHYKLKWKESTDTIIDGQVASLVEKIVIRRKLGSVPTDENDGTFVAEFNRTEFGSHEDVWYIDDSFTPNIGDRYYYKAFPFSTLGFTNYSSENETDGILCKDYVLYGLHAVHINGGESDPDSMFVYTEDNKGFRPACMNYAADSFSYGDWKDAWFIKNLRPVMLNYDGTVAYELDKNDYSKRLDGSPSDIYDNTFEGNAMIEFPKVYWKIVDNGDDTADIFISDKKVDDSFHCWSHLDKNGNEIDFCYMPIYNGWVDSNGKLRSLSGRTPLTKNTRIQEVNYALANNPSGKNIWLTEVYSDWMLVNILLILMGRSTDSKKVFGRGNNNSYVNTTNTGIKNSGTMDQKGLFWGSQDNVSGVKVFGMEHFWGNIWRGIAGWILDKTVQKIKLTFGTADGTETEGYNYDGTGYISIPNSTPSGTNGGFLNKMLFTEDGLIPVVSNGSATTFYTVGFWYDTAKVNYALVGGSAADASCVGALCAALSDAVSAAVWHVGASISCKPLKESA